MTQGRLIGNAALVTGGGSGIGRAICEVFAREGASVAVVDINAEGIEETLKRLRSDHGNLHCGINCNVTSVEQIKSSFITANEKLGKKVKILINNAGILDKGNFLDDTTEQEFDDVIGINLKGTFLMSREFLKSLKSNDVADDGDTRGVIVNMSSIAGKMGKAKRTPYSSSKFGIIGITKTMASEYPKHQVRCNAVLPSGIETPMFGSISKEWRDYLEKETPMGRFGKPEEVANVCLFLSSDESSYVNGACLEVTGGRVF